MHHLVGGAFEELDWNLAAYTETVTAPYRVPRSIVEITAWQGLSLHVHGCELSGMLRAGEVRRDVRGDKRKINVELIMH